MGSKRKACKVVVWILFRICGQRRPKVIPRTPPGTLQLQSHTPMLSKHSFLDARVAHFLPKYTPLERYKTHTETIAKIIRICGPWAPNGLPKVCIFLVSLCTCWFQQVPQEPLTVSALNLRLSPFHLSPSFPFTLSPLGRPFPLSPLTLSPFTLLFLHPFGFKLESLTPPCGP